MYTAQSFVDPAAANEFSKHMARLIAQFNTPKKKVRSIPKIDPNKEYTEEEIVAMLKELPDVNRFPLPESWYSKYDFEKPEPMSMQEVLKTSFQTMFAPSYGPVEERGPVEGGIRIISQEISNEASEVTQPSEKVEGSI